jgi:hypothetical protein
MSNRTDPDYASMTTANDRHTSRLPVQKTAGNPEGKGVHAFLDDWRASEPRGIVAKPQRQVLAELFTSMLVLSASFRYQPVPGCSNYLYWIDGQWSLSLIAPHEWSEERRAGFAGTCVLQRDMTWTIDPPDRLVENGPLLDAIRRLYDGFAAMLDTERTLEEILPYCVGRLHYYQRLYAGALSRSVSATLQLGEQAAMSCRQWQAQLPGLDNVLPAQSG